MVINKKMYELIGNVVFVWFSFGLYNYCVNHAFYETLRDLAQCTNFSHICTGDIKNNETPPLAMGTIFPHNIDLKNRPTAMNDELFKLSKLGVSKLRVLCEESIDLGGTSKMSQYAALRFLICGSSECDASYDGAERDKCITKLSQYAPLKIGVDISCSTIRIFDSITPRNRVLIQRPPLRYDCYPTFTNNQYKIDFVEENRVLLNCKNAVASFFGYIGVNKQIEKISEGYMRNIGFNRCSLSADQIGWRYVVPNTQPIIFFPEPGFGSRIAYWGHCLKHFGRTVYIFEHPKNLCMGVFSPSSVLRPKSYPAIIDFDMCYHLSHDIIAHSSRAIDAANHIKKCVEHNSYLFIAPIVAHEDEPMWTKHPPNRFFVHSQHC
jgi:hypothetical protein